MTTYAWFVRGQAHSAMARVSMAAVRRVDRSATLVVATDDPEVTVPDAQMVRFEPGLPMMVANIEAQLHVLAPRRSDVWFLDTDVLLLREPPHLNDGEICITWRDNLGGKLSDIKEVDVMPYNFGVVGIKPGLRTIEAWLWTRERIRVMSPHLQDWYGNQVALAGLAGPRPIDGEATDLRSIPWKMSEPGPSVAVRKIPGDTWNYTPAEPDEDISARAALHFKGHSRGLMAGYAIGLGLDWPTNLEIAA